MTALLGLCAMMLTVADRPNVVVILADDVGYGDLSCYGATKVQTPNIDRIARDGIRFADAHSPSTVCTPTRYSLMTGEYAFRHAPGAGILNGVAPLSIPADKPTLPKLMKLEGYRTGVVGKWHLGLGKGETDYNGLITPGPEAVGFDESFIMPATGDRVPCVYVENGRVAGYEPQDPIRVSFRAKIGDEPTGRENPELLKIKPVVGHADTIINGVSRIGWMSGGKRARWTDETMADTFAEKAVAFIERNRYKPFFLYLATHDVHAPLLPHERFNGKSQAGLRGDTLAELDWTVGEVQKVLDRHGLTMNTLIVFTSDNGGVESDGYSDPREDLNGHKVNGVLRGFKYSLYEGGHRVPFVLSWPDKVARGMTSAALISQTDLMPSLAAILGGRIDPTLALDGLDVSSALTGKSSQGRRDLVHHRGGADSPLAYREGRWVLVPKGSDWELYDLETDLAQEQNVASLHQDRVERMAARLARAKTR